MAIVRKTAGFRRIVVGFERHCAVGVGELDVLHAIGDAGHAGVDDGRRHTERRPKRIRQTLELRAHLNRGDLRSAVARWLPGLVDGTGKLRSGSRSLGADAGKCDDRQCDPRTRGSESVHGCCLVER
jgi:hypothetical protein